MPLLQTFTSLKNCLFCWEICCIAYSKNFMVLFQLLVINSGFTALVMSVIEVILNWKS